MKRRNNPARGLLLAAFLVSSAPLLADNLAGSQTFLCAAREVFACSPGDSCSALDPADLNVPDFLLVDLAAKQLRTTAASGENRATAILQMSRDQGLLFLQGIDMGRAWSFLIIEETGDLTASVARENLSVSVFGVCTPATGGPR